MFVCVIAGTTLAAEPTWTLTKGAKTAEAAGPTWQEVTGQPGPNGNDTDTTTWTQQKNTTVSLGQIIKNDAGTFLFICDTAGTAGSGAEPSFNTTLGATTADNSVTWRCIQATNSYADWAAPFARLQSACGTGWMAAGDSLFVGSDHAETQAAAMSFTFPGLALNPNKIYSILHSGAITLAAATITAGASMTTTGANALTVAGLGFSIQGMTISCGTGATAVVLTIGSTARSRVLLEDCVLQKLGTTSSGLALTLGNTTGRIILRNTMVTFGSISDSMVAQGIFTWEETAAILSGGSVPLVLISSSSTTNAGLMSGLGLQQFSSGQLLIQSSASGNLQAWVIENCVTAASLVIAVNAAAGDNETIDVVNTDSAGTNYTFSRYTPTGTLAHETVLVRTGGASNGTTQVSYNITTTANSSWIIPFLSPPIPKPNGLTAVNITARLYGIWNAAALPNNDEIWPDACYFGSASSPLYTCKTGGKANNLATGTSLAADSTSAWDSLVTARANGETVAVGAKRKVASNPGRVFFCTAIGTGILDSSEPAGYATAVDGGSVTDGGATFRAGMRFLMDVALSSPQPAMAGPVIARVYAAKVSSTFYVDPKLYLLVA